MSKRSNWSIPYVVFLVLFVVLPLVLVLVYAFQDNSGHFTLGNITKFFTDKDALSTFAVSLEVALENTASPWARGRSCSVWSTTTFRS